MERGGGVRVFLKRLCVQRALQNCRPGVAEIALHRRPVQRKYVLYSVQSRFSVQKKSRTPYCRINIYSESQTSHGFVGRPTPTTFLKDPTASAWLPLWRSDAPLSVACPPPPTARPPRPPPIYGVFLAYFWFLGNGLPSAGSRPPGRPPSRPPARPPDRPLALPHGGPPAPRPPRLPGD